MNQLMRFEPVRGLRREFDRLFDDFLPALAQDGSATWTPALDITENEEAYLAQLDLPGMKASDIEVHFDEGMLTVRGERSHRASEAREGLLRSERSFGQFYRSVRLPRDTNSEAVEAAFEDGVLTVTIPKMETSQPRQIEVRSPAVHAGGDGANTPVAPEV